PKPKFPRHFMPRNNVGPEDSLGKYYDITKNCKSAEHAKQGRHSYDCARLKPAASPGCPAVSHGSVLIIVSEHTHVAGFRQLADSFSLEYPLLVLENKT